MRRIGLLIDDRYLLHDPGTLHPESPRRLAAIQEAVQQFGPDERWQRIEPRRARPEEIELVHHPSHLQHIQRAAQQAPAYLDPDTAVSSHSYDTALLAAGGVLRCTEMICNGELERAFALVRPPGHHAEPDRAMGFCLFNNVALAAAYARIEQGLERVAVVDIDLHHGNGTQACFYRDPHVLYLSSHQFPLYPGTGDGREVGLKDGKGYTVNFPLPPGTGDEAFVPVYTKIVAPILEQYQPQIILVSAGFDAYFEDPLGSLNVTSDGYGSAAASLIRAADSCCGGKICFVLEGGYSREGLQKCTQAVMAELEAENPRERSIPDGPLFEQICVRTRRYVSDFWKW